MDFKSIQSLGNKIEERYRKVNYNESQFPEIAKHYLDKFQFDYQWNAIDVAEFVSTMLPVPTHIFSNLPITVFRAREFYIELLNWTTSSPAIHQHAFSGAFKVVAGSSLHSHYSFEQSMQINADVLLGNVKCNSLERLSTGDVREILAGEQMTHCLFHLDHPSATLVVRTNGHPMYAPQYTLYPRHLAINNRWISDAQIVKYYLSLLRITYEIGYTEFLNFMVRHVARLDFALLVAVGLQSSEYFKGSEDLHKFLLEAGNRHGAELMTALRSAIETRDHLRQLSKIRLSSKDPDMRFFVALLMNATNQETLLQVVKLLYPNEDPKEKCAGWLRNLCDHRTDVAKQLLELAVKESGGNIFHLSSKIAANIPKNTSPDERIRFLKMAVNGSNDPDFLQNPEWHSGLERIRAIPELAGLFY